MKKQENFNIRTTQAPHSCKLPTTSKRTSSLMIHLLLVLLLGQPQKPLKTPIKVSVLPQRCVSPCEVRVILTVEPALDNEKVVLTFESDDSGYFRLSELPQIAAVRPDGTIKFPPKVSWIYYKGIPSGNYLLKVGLVKRGKENVVSLISTPIEVIGP